MNNSVKSITALFCICLVITLFLALINFVTAPIIEEGIIKAETKALYEVLPDAEDFSKFEKSDDVPASVTGIYADTGGSGYAVTLSTESQYSSSPMLIAVGFSPDGMIGNIRLISYNESKDFGSDYPQTFITKDKDGIDGIDAVAGVTYSSEAFKRALIDAYEGLEAVGVEFTSTKGVQE